MIAHRNNYKNLKSGSNLHHALQFQRLPQHWNRQRVWVYDSFWSKEEAHHLYRMVWIEGANRWCNQTRPCCECAHTQQLTLCIPLSKGYLVIGVVFQRSRVLASPFFSSQVSNTTQVAKPLGIALRNARRIRLLYREVVWAKQHDLWSVVYSKFSRTLEHFLKNKRSNINIKSDFQKWLTLYFLNDLIDISFNGE